MLKFVFVIEFYYEKFFFVMENLYDILFFIIKVYLKIFLIIFIKFLYLIICVQKVSDNNQVMFDYFEVYFIFCKIVFGFFWIICYNV